MLTWCHPKLTSIDAENETIRVNEPTKSDTSPLSVLPSPLSASLLPVTVTVSFFYFSFSLLWLSFNSLLPFHLPSSTESRKSWASLPSFVVGPSMPRIILPMAIRNSTSRLLRLGWLPCLPLRLSPFRLLSGLYVPIPKSSKYHLYIAATNYY